MVYGSFALIPIKFPSWQGMEDVYHQAHSFHMVFGNRNDKLR